MPTFATLNLAERFPEPDKPITYWVADWFSESLSAIPGEQTVRDFIKSVLDRLTADTDNSPVQPGAWDIHWSAGRRELCIYI